MAHGGSPASVLPPWLTTVPRERSCRAHGGHAAPGSPPREERLTLRLAEVQPGKPKGELPPSHRGRILLPAAATAQGSGTDLTSGENHLFPITR